MKNKLLNPMDAMFLYGESRETMMHVAALMPFTPPADAQPDFLRQLMDELKQTLKVEAPWNKKLRKPKGLRNPLNSWVEDDQFDIEYHVRRSALPSPGDERELGILVSRLHSNPLDFTRPPWEIHLIEGLEGGRFAFYVKVHHALVDGYTSSKILSRSLATDPDERDTPMFFSRPQPKRPPRDPSSTAAPLDLNSLFQGVMNDIRDVAKPLSNLIKKPGVEFQSLVSSMQAPHSILNKRISRTRRFATQQYSLPLLRELAKKSGGTLNDIVLAICAGGLRKFLLELGELPEQPLIAFLPVNVRPKDDPGGGNAIGATLVSLATDVADPYERLQAIMRSTRKAKKQMENLTQNTIIAYSAFLMAPSGLQVVKAMTGIRGRLPLTFNLCISNVPGPDTPRYFRGARLEASYPQSIPMHGMALNITCYSYADTMNFGFIGCRDTLPHLQRLAVYSGEALRELEEMLGE